MGAPTQATVTSLLTEIAEIGRDGATGGYRRFAWTADDAALGEWFAAACAQRGLDVTTDRCGNQWAWWGDPDAHVDDAPATGRGVGPGVVVGSHLDSVPDGGAFDGPLGVAAALVAVDALRAHGFEPQRPLGVVRFVDEEGARFGLACSGSRLLTGLAEPQRVLGLRDGSGTTYGDAMGAAGVEARHVGRDEETLRRIGAFVELHIEQGRGLATPEVAAQSGSSAIAVASRIRPHGRWRIDLRGRADHAGTTLLSDRDDPMLAFAAFVVAVRTAAERAGAVATVGKVDVRPNAVNAIPSQVTAWLDVRADTAEQVRAVLSELRTVLAGLGAGRGLDLIEESWTEATELDEPLTGRVADAIASMGTGGSVPVLATGAGHDAGVLAQAGVASSMIFVRNPTGISHSPAEWAEPDDCEAGAAALTAVLADLCADSWEPQSSRIRPIAVAAGEGGSQA